MKYKLHVLILCLLISGCSIFTPQKDDSMFYTLGEHASASSVVSDGNSSGLKVINLLIDEVPAYADCPYIVTKHDKNKLFLSQKNRWGEPFEDGCSSLLEDKMSELMSDYAVVISSVHADGNMVLCNYRLSISFDDLIYNAEEKGIVLKCSWSFFDYAKKKQILIRKYTSLVEVNAPTYDNVVDGMKSALILLSKEISDNVERAIVNDEVDESAETLD